MFQERWHLGHAGGLPSPDSFGTRSVKTFVSVLPYVVAKSASAAGHGNILRKASAIITQRRLLSQAKLDCSAKEQHLGVFCKPIRAFDRSWTSSHAGMMRTAILIGTILGLAPAFAQEAPSVWRDPDGGCVYFKLGDTLSLLPAGWLFRLSRRATRNQPAIRDHRSGTRRHSRRCPGRHARHRGAEPQAG